MTKIVLTTGTFFLIISTVYSQTINEWSLERCIEYAYTQNITIRKSKVSNKRFEVYAEQAKAQWHPNLSSSFYENFTWSTSPETGNMALKGASGSNFSVNSAVTLFNASRIKNQIRQAGLEIEGGKYSLETTKELINISILNAYLQVLYAEEQVNNSQKQRESTTSQVELAAERLERQLISVSDYAQVKSQLASEKLTLANSESQLSIAKINLMQLMELPVQDNFGIEHPNLQTEINQGPVPDVKTIYETALESKPQIKNAEIKKKIAGLDEKIAKASYFPVLSASAGISSGYSSVATDPYFSQMNSGMRPTVGIALSIPIYQKKQVKTSVSVARLGYEDAQLNETDTKNQLRKNIEQACLDVTSAHIEFEASAEKYRATEESAALSDEKFKQGIINSVDYLVSKTNLIVAESQLLQSKYNLIFSYKILDFYMGIPLSL